MVENKAWRVTLILFVLSLVFERKGVGGDGLRAMTSPSIKSATNCERRAGPTSVAQSSESLVVPRSC